MLRDTSTLDTQEQGIELATLGWQFNSLYTLSFCHPIIFLIIIILIIILILIIIITVIILIEQGFKDIVR